MTSNAKDPEAIFLAALDMAKPDERAAYVETACAGDAELLARVRKLLACHDGTRGPLDAPPPGFGATIGVPIPSERPGTTIGPYKVLQQISEGGMGTVYMAEQTEPVKRKVALKVIKPGMDSRQIIARFEAERQALALMDHVNIARVLDAGATESGRPHFVMELVHGVPITKYCDDNRLTPRGRLELFVQVCQAIQHAHQKGIIPRDVDGTATTGDNDYVAHTGTLTFAPGETSKTIAITVNGDSKKEADETFYLDLFGNSSNSLFAKDRGIGTILNDD